MESSRICSLIPDSIEMCSGCRFVCGFVCVTAISTQKVDFSKKKPSSLWHGKKLPASFSSQAVTHKPTIIQAAPGGSGTVATPVTFSVSQDATQQQQRPANPGLRHAIPQVPSSSRLPTPQAVHLKNSAPPQLPQAKTGPDKTQQQHISINTTQTRPTSPEKSVQNTAPPPFPPGKTGAVKTQQQQSPISTTPNAPANCPTNPDDSVPQFDFPHTLAPSPSLPPKSARSSPSLSSGGKQIVRKVDSPPNTRSPAKYTSVSPTRRSASPVVLGNAMPSCDTFPPPRGLPGEQSQESPTNADSQDTTQVHTHS